ncbi:hypothetical protein ACQWHJ_24985, partial [Salmonella enterica subsp. enterica serovar Infantis]
NFLDFHMLGFMDCYLSFIDKFVPTDGLVEHSVLFVSVVVFFLGFFGASLVLRVLCFGWGFSFFPVSLATGAGLT